MSPSAPIDITYSKPAAPSPSSSYASSSSSLSSGLYIPVHKRTASPSTGSSSRSSSPALSTRSDSEHVGLPGVYTPSDLILLAGSPLARLPLETLTSLRENVPDIMLNRRQRKGQQHFQGLKSHSSTQHARPVPNRRPPGRSGSGRRRTTAVKVVDELNWRGAVTVLSQAS